MQCVKCKSHTKVINTGRTSDRGIKQPQSLSSKDDFTMRRMECPTCGNRFNSIELTCDDYNRLRERFRNELLGQISQLTENNNV